MKDSATIKTLLRTLNNKSQVNLTKLFENVGTDLLKFCKKHHRKYLIGS